MPSQNHYRRSLLHSTSRNDQHRKTHYRKSLVISVTVVATTLVILLLLVLWYLRSRKFSRNRDIQSRPSEDRQANPRKLQKFTYKELKKATNRFDESQKLGKGGYGVVYRGFLRNGEEVAVKKLVLSSIQGEREFQNELSICTRLESRYVVKLLGFATHGDKTRLLVYECMQNRSLQEALLEKHTSVHLDWDRRFNIILDIARALAYLHLECHPPVVHGDVKPSNVLLDGDFHAYLADFGLARMKIGDQRLDQAPERSKSDVIELEVGTPESTEIVKSKSFGVVLEEKRRGKLLDDRVLGSFGDHSLPSSYLGSPHSGIRFSSEMRMDGDVTASNLVIPFNHHPDQSPRGKCSPNLDDSQTSMQNEDLTSTLAESASMDQPVASLPTQQVVQKVSNKDNWWWKQENSGELKVRDYVMEWMRSELSTDESHNVVTSSQQNEHLQKEEGRKEAALKRKERQEQRKRRVKAVEEEQKREVDEANNKEKAKARVGRKGREWWKDEYFAELSKKGARNQAQNKALNNKGAGGSLQASTDHIRSRDMTGTNFSRVRGDSMGDMAAIDDLSTTTTSMRGTVCYVAPEFGGIGLLSEASDIYSFGVLLLVIISGRRPIEIMTTATKSAGAASSIGSSPTARRFERANLITWARSLACSGNIFDLVDDRLCGSYPRDQVQLCILLALLCIRRLPSARPSIASVVKILQGEAPLPPLPVEFSPSPPSRLSVHHSPRAAASVLSSNEDIL